MISEFRGPFRWLSNYHSVNIEFDGYIYPSTEHAYQAAKTLDEAEREMIRLAPKPGDAKRLGYTVTLRDDWTVPVRLYYMETFNRQKYRKENYDLYLKLLATEREELVEGNTWNDTFWGVCNGVGDNHLGKILMKIRRQLYANIVFEHRMRTVHHC